MDYATLSQKQLFELIKTDDINAISFIYFKHADNLYRYGLKFTSNEQLVEDCLHDLFLELITKRYSLNVRNDIRYYLFRAFRNNLLRMLSREERLLKRPSEEIFDALCRIESMSFDEAEITQDKTELISALQQLSIRQREAIYLRFMNGLEYDEIAMIMKMEIESCRNTIYRAIKSLRKNLSGLSLLFLFKSN